MLLFLVMQLRCYAIIDSHLRCTTKLKSYYVSDENIIISKYYNNNNNNINNIDE